MSTTEILQAAAEFDATSTVTKEATEIFRAAVEFDATSSVLMKQPPMLVRCGSCDKSLQKALENGESFHFVDKCFATFRCETCVEVTKALVRQPDDDKRKSNVCVVDRGCDYYFRGCAYYALCGQQPRTKKDKCTLNMRKGWYLNFLSNNLCIKHGEMHQACHEQLGLDALEFEKFDNWASLFHPLNPNHPVYLIEKSRFVEDLPCNLADMHFPTPLCTLQGTTAITTRILRHHQTMLRRAYLSFYLPPTGRSGGEDGKRRGYWPWRAKYLTINHKEFAQCFNIRLGAIRAWIPIDYSDHPDEKDDDRIPPEDVCHTPKPGFLLRTYALVYCNSADATLYGRMATMVSDSHLFVLEGTTSSNPLWWCVEEDIRSTFAHARQTLTAEQFLTEKYALVMEVDQIIHMLELSLLIDEYIGHSSQAARRLHLHAPWRSLIRSSICQF